MACVGLGRVWRVSTVETLRYVLQGDPKGDHLYVDLDRGNIVFGVKITDEMGVDPGGDLVTLYGDERVRLAGLLRGCSRCIDGEPEQEFSVCSVDGHLK